MTVCWYSQKQSINSSMLNKLIIKNIVVYVHKYVLYIKLVKLGKKKTLQNAHLYILVNFFATNTVHQEDSHNGLCI